MWRTPATLAGSLEDVPNPGRRMSILALETSCDDTCAAVLDAEGGVRSNVISSQHAHERFGGVVPEIASRHHLELVNAVVARRSRRRGRARGDRAGRRDAGSRADRRAARRASRRRRRSRRRASCRSRRSTTCRDTSRRTSSRGDRRRAFEPPFLCLIASGGHTLLAHVDEHDGYEVLGPHARRRRRRGFRQGRAHARPRLPRRRGARAARRQAAMPPRSRSRARPASVRSAARRAQGLRRGPRLLLRGPEDGAALHDCASCRSEERERARGRPRRLLPGGDRREPARAHRAGARADRPASAWPSAAASRPTASCAGGWASSTPRCTCRRAALCTDNAAMIASAARFAPRLAYPDYLALDAYATGETPR